MKRYFIPLLLVGTTVLAQSPNNASLKAPPKPADFAMQMPLTVSGRNGVVQLQLPLAVYEHAQTASLQDVRVFNASGHAVPFAFIQASADATVKWRTNEAKLFPVLSDAIDTSNASFELDVRAAQDGALLSVQSRSRGKRTANRLTALVLDIGPPRADETLADLQLFLPNSTVSYRAALAVEQSDDLKLWDRVAQTRVDWLQGVTQTSEPSDNLVNDRVELAPRVGRYLRIHWLDGTPLQFARVVARWRSTETPSDAALELVLNPSPGKVAGDFAYRSFVAIAADEIGLNLPNPNTVLPVSIGFYRQQLAPQRQWLFDAIAHSTFYRLDRNGVERVSSRLHIPPHSNREWVVRPHASTTDAPELVLRWHPHTIAFTAQGVRTTNESSKFTLAFGAQPSSLKQWTTSEAPLSSVAPGFTATELNQLEHAIAGTAVATATTQPIEEVESPADKINNRTLALWAVLLFGTLLLGGMSWRLYRQMKKNDAAE